MRACAATSGGVAGPVHLRGHAWLEAHGIGPTGLTVFGGLAREHELLAVGVRAAAVPPLLVCASTARSKSVVRALYAWSV